MKAIEFDGTITSDGQIAIPENIASQLPHGESFHVVLQWDAATDGDFAWRAQGQESFEAAYAPEDAIYERLIDEPSIR